ncbi:phytoene/squalene synthase family protein [Luteolibacter luteus]|uniref:Squalene/phytoene synthase family protein n=1 Tax=Luteolibacter luteus TaxID=2728835 RepID=A0A858RKB2_9BACT|nr:squalene/phytoene synthase family protein [Luteolibacter luteus]QJE96898.1 squalene/phytoene synthase family protein [Luteolibacter luteus]
MTDSAEITKQAKSNLAFALQILPKDRRDGMVTFYAFCRVVDDLADDPDRPIDEREAALKAWKQGLESGFENPDPLQLEVIALMEKYSIPVHLLTAIIDGCLMDLRPQRFGTWEDLEQYTYKVACAVGLASLKVFGAQDPASERYAVALGHALQLTNILRDVGEDLSNGVRIYLPLADMARFQYTERDLIGRVYDGRFMALMAFEAERAERFYREAIEIMPKSDAKALVPAEIMRSIYQTLLEKMKRDHFKVFNQRYRLSKARKMAIFSKHLLRLGATA